MYRKVALRSVRRQVDEMEEEEGGLRPVDGRDVVFLGETLKTRVKTAEHLRAWWCLSEFKIVKEQRGSFMEWRPDYWVVRVSLLDMSAGTYERFMHDVEWATDEAIVKQL